MLNKEKSKNDKILYYKFNIDDGMMYRQPFPWETKESPYSGKGDALWRTGISYISYGDKDLLNGIKNCFRKFDMINYKGKYWYQLSRASNRYKEDDVSRDQTILALSALRFNGDDELLKEYAKHLPFKLSRRFNMTINMWFWVKYLETNNLFYDFIFKLLTLLENIIQISITKILRKIAGMDKHYPPSEPGKYINPNNTEKLSYKIYNTLKFPAYSLHLSAWKLYSTKNKGILWWLNKKIILWEAEKDNYLIRLLMGKEISQELIDNYRPTNQFRWSLRLDGDSWIEYISNDKSEYNCIEIDVLKSIKNKSNI